jgi:hypothetical protein
LSPEATGLCIARTVTAPGKEKAAAGEGIAPGGRVQGARQQIDFRRLRHRREKPGQQYDWSWGLAQAVTSFEIYQTGLSVEVSAGGVYD